MVSVRIVIPAILVCALQAGAEALHLKLPDIDSGRMGAGRQFDDEPRRDK